MKNLGSFILKSFGNGSVKLNILVVAVVAVFVIPGCEKNHDPLPEEYDNLIVYGNIYTAKVNTSKVKNDNSRYIMADALVVKDGKFVCVGSKADAEKFKSEKTTILRFRMIP